MHKDPISNARVPSKRRSSQSTDTRNGVLSWKRPPLAAQQFALHGHTPGLLSRRFRETIDQQAQKAVLLRPTHPVPATTNTSTSSREKEATTGLNRVIPPGRLTPTNLPADRPHYSRLAHLSLRTGKPYCMRLALSSLRMSTTTGRATLTDGQRETKMRTQAIPRHTMTTHVEATPSRLGGGRDRPINHNRETRR